MEGAAFVLKSEFELPHTNAKGYAGMVDYMTDKEKVKKGEAYNDPDYLPDGILSYMADEKKSSGLFTREKNFVDKEDVLLLKQQYQEAERNGSLQWKFVGSFQNDWLQENGLLNPENQLDERLLKKSVRAMMDRLMKEEKFLPRNTLWTASFHYNTDNIHFHISLVEKENTRELVRRRNRKIEKSLSADGMQNRFYRDQGSVSLQPKGKLKQPTLDKMKSSFLNELTREKRQYFLETQTDLRNTVVQELTLPKENLQQRKEIQRILSALPKDQKQWHYKIISKQYPVAKQRIDQYTRQYLETSGQGDTFRKAVRDEEVFRKKLYGGTNEYAQNQLADLEYRLGNRLLKEMKEQLKEKKQKRNVSRIIQTERQRQERPAATIRFTLRDRRRLDRALGNEYEKKLNLLYYEQTEREAEWERKKQEYGIE